MSFNNRHQNMNSPHSDETHPLLLNTQEQVSEALVDEAQEDSTQHSGQFRLFCSLLVDSIPVILSYSLQNSIQASTILITARLGPEELSVASVALMLAFVTGESITDMIYLQRIPTSSEIP